MSAPRPAVSVITANRNGARHLAAAIRSVLNQSLRDLELIIVDDASTDDSVAVIERAAAGDPRVTLLRQETNTGPAAARNRALALARGRWIAVFDGDDLMAPDRLARLVARGEADHADLVVDNLMVFEDGREAPWRPLLGGREFGAARWIGLAEYIRGNRLYAKQPALGYLKPLICGRILDQTGVRYDERLRIGEDYDLVLRLLAKGARLRFDPAALYRYRRHGASTSSLLRRDDIERMAAADRLFEAEMGRQPLAVRRAQAARRRSLANALIYDRVIARLKAKDLAGALWAGAGTPQVWPMLAMPVQARLKRLAARLRPAAAPAGSAAAA